MRSWVIVCVIFLPIVCGAQNIGIGNNKPSAPLSFPNTFGAKVLLWGQGTATNHYGIGYHNNQLQFYSDENFTRVSLGVGQSSAYSELLTIHGNGRVGIYNSNPDYTLDVAGRVRLNGYDSSFGEIGDIETVYIQPALFFNNNSNSASPVRVATYGLRNIFGDYYANYFGIFNGAGKLRLGTNHNSTLVVNGNAGTPGQVLRSGDYYGEASWQNSIAADIYNQAANSQPYSAYQITGKPSEIIFDRDFFNDLSHNTYTLAGPSRVLVKFDLNCFASECAACGPSTFDVQVTYNGNVARTFRFSLPNNTNASVTGSGILTLPAGNYQLALRAYLVSGPVVQVNGSDVYPPGHMTVHVIPKQ